MKKHYIILFALSVILASCSYDNYDAPQSTFQGKIVYNGEAINIERSNWDINNANVYLELWEPGWQKKAPIRVIVDQDGSFHSLLFNASYKLIIPDGVGPFMSKINTTTNSDTIPVNISGNKTMDIEITPYYIIKTPSFSVSGRTVTASCQLEKIITDSNAKDIERVTLYISKTIFADSQTNIATIDLNGDAITDFNSVSLSKAVPTFASMNLPDQNYVFARIGVKIKNINSMIFTPVQKLQL